MRGKGRAARRGSQILQKYGRSALNQEQLNLSQQENGLAGADMPAVATNFAQAQIASQATVNAIGEGF